MNTIPEYMYRMIQKKSGVISHPIKSVFFVQIQNRNGKKAVGDIFLCIYKLVFIKKDLHCVSTLRNTLSEIGYLENMRTDEDMQLGESDSYFIAL